VTGITHSICVDEVNVALVENPELNKHAAVLVSLKLFPMSVTVVPPDAEINRGTVRLTIGDVYMLIAALCDHCGAGLSSKLNDRERVYGHVPPVNPMAGVEHTADVPSADTLPPV